MTTAILYSGQARTFRLVRRNQWWMVLRHFPDAHVFASVADDAEADDMLALSKMFEGRFTFEKVTQPDCTKQIGLTEETAKRAAAHAAFTISSPPEAILRQLWHLQRVYELFKAHKESGLFDAVVRIRPDLHFHRFEVPQPPAGHWCYSPWWGGYSGINDRLAIMGPQAAESYFGTWSRIHELLVAGCPLHPESLVAASLERSNVYSQRTLKAEFSAVRPTGQLVFPDMQLYDIYR